MTDRLKIPKFPSEADEANWWFDHREEVAKAFEEAAADGSLRPGSVARFARKEPAASGITPTTLSQPKRKN